MKKETAIVAAYVAFAVSTTVRTGVELYKTFKRDKPMQDQIKEAKKNN